MIDSPDLSHAHLRIARPTDNLAAVVAFYRDGLGFEVLGEFRDHDGFDGVMLGRQGAAYHLELTVGAGHRAGRAPTADNLLVFTCPTRRNGKPPSTEWSVRVTRRSRRSIRIGFDLVARLRSRWLSDRAAARKLAPRCHKTASVRRSAAAGAVMKFHSS